MFKKNNNNNVINNYTLFVTCKTSNLVNKF